MCDRIDRTQTLIIVFKYDDSRVFLSRNVDTQISWWLLAFSKNNSYCEKNFFSFCDHKTKEFFIFSQKRFHFNDASEMINIISELFFSASYSHDVFLSISATDLIIWFRSASSSKFDAPTVSEEVISLNLITINFVSFSMRDKIVSKYISKKISLLAVFFKTISLRNSSYHVKS